MLLGLFLLIGCTTKSPIDDYVREDIVLEVGQKISITDVVDLEKIDNDVLKESLEKASVEIDYGNNQKVSGEIKEDKIFATNAVEVKYEYEKKEYEQNIDVSIKDTQNPVVKLGTDYVFALVKSTKTEEQIIEDLKMKVMDNGKYTVNIEGYDDINFDEIGEHKLNVIVKDEADNTVKNEMTLFVGKESVTYTYKVKKVYGNGYVNYDVTLPSEITSYYDVTIGKVKKENPNREQDFNQTITLKNSKHTIQMDVVAGLVTGFYEMSEIYQIRNNEVAFYKKGKYKDFFGYTQDRKENSSVIMNKKDQAHILLMLNSKNADYNEMKRVTNLIAANTREY